jgi:hypothetical protein
MKRRLLPIVIALAALAVSASAAFYSVFGLSKLFAGASMQVIIMASSLEFAKLVVASLLYQYWDTINKALRTYLSISVLILMLITSGGIYGYLSGAYQETANQSEYIDKQISIIEKKRSRFEERRVDLNQSIMTWTEALSNPTTIQYVDKETGQLVTTTSSRQRRLLESQLNEAKTTLNAVTDSITKLDMEVLDQQIGNETARELGPLKYLSNLLNIEMDKIINWFLLLIIFVFDPLAISLVVAANFAFSQIQTKSYRKKLNDTIECSLPDGAEWDVSYSVKNGTEYTDKLEELRDNKSKSFNDLKSRIEKSQSILKSKNEIHIEKDIYKEKKPKSDKRPGGYWF